MCDIALKIGLVSIIVAFVFETIVFFTKAGAFSGIDFLKTMKDCARVGLVFLMLAWIFGVEKKQYQQVAAMMLNVSILCFLGFFLGIISGLFMNRFRNDSRSSLCASLSRVSLRYGIIYFILAYLLK